MALRQVNKVTLDATGTLFRPKQSVSDVYLSYFLAVMPKMNETPNEISMKDFGMAFKTNMISSPNFGAASNNSKNAREWWGNVIKNTLPMSMQTHMEQHPVPATRFIDALYSFYAKGEAWEVYPDVLPALELLHDRNISIGVISNFDERIDGILTDLQLHSSFEFVLTSWNHGNMKPMASIFHEAARIHGCEPGCILHIGDDPINDFKGATEAGFQSRLLCRGGKHAGQLHCYETLQDILQDSIIN